MEVYSITLFNFTHVFMLEIFPLKKKTKIKQTGRGDGSVLELDGGDIKYVKNNWIIQGSLCALCIN